MIKSREYKYNLNYFNKQLDCPSNFQNVFYISDMYYIILVFGTKIVEHHQYKKINPCSKFIILYIKIFIFRVPIQKQYIETLKPLTNNPPFFHNSNFQTSSIQDKDSIES